MGGAVSPKAPVGVFGIGRIGKLLVWYLSARKEHDTIVIATGRKTGQGLEDLATYLAYDSTYGPYSRFAGGFTGKSAVEIKNGALYLSGVKVVWLSDAAHRTPGGVPWSDNGVEVVFDTTGKYTDPTVNDDNSLRGHLNHAKKVVLSAPFKIKKKGTPLPSDALTLVGGVNFPAYDAAAHDVISNASCTTNCCAPPIKALVDHFGERFNSQSVLDVLPRDCEKDTRKRRSTLNNLIPTSTGAANAVIEVIPDIRELGIGSQASSIRVPTMTGSIVILDISLLGDYDNEHIHGIFREYARRNPDIMLFSTEQLVSADIVGGTYSTIYDSRFTHRRTSKRGDGYYTMVDLNFWYDNEFGYVCSLGRLYGLLTGKR